MDSLDLALDYHERTKHGYARGARGPASMDWSTQPDPFRRYEGATLHPLPLPSQDTTPPYGHLYYRHPLTPRPVTLETVSEFFFYSMALSAWKTFRDAKWALRVNPSSGNLHGTEAYVLLPGLERLQPRPGIYHYAPEAHGLEKRADIAVESWQRLLADAPSGSFLVGLSTIHWREAWKYGERAYRYCQHDIGHALASLRLSASALGWTLRGLSRPSDDDISRLLGLDRADDFDPEERETPALLALVVPSGAAFTPEYAPLPRAVEEAAAGAWFGKARPLSPEHHPWEIIDQVSEACKKPRTETPDLPAAAHGDRPAPADGPGTPSAGKIVRQRRSALALDGATGLSRERFYGMLARIVPALTAIPWDGLDWPLCVHLGLFVHRVEGLPPGLYALARDRAKIDLLKLQMNPAFIWQTPPGCPEGLPLFLLLEKDVRSLATGVSCGQDIAGDGAFSLGMLAQFEPILREHGAHFYRRLFWETGAIGQVLYLEAEAVGLRATGIGCFFDDPVHEAFGISSPDLQSLYHFTVGGPVEDTRLSTLPAYPELAWNPR